MPKFRLMVARFPYRPEEPETVDWLMELVSSCDRDPRLAETEVVRIADTPITMTRNDAVLRAVQGGYDLLLMVDNDMAPDCESRAKTPDPEAKPFWPVALDFVLNHPGPCVVGAPYCGPPPDENVYVFRWRNKESHCADPSDSLQMFTREEAAALSGVQEVAALPTGLILFDVRAFAKLPPPWFSYQYKGDGPDCPACKQPFPRLQAEKASTEDVVLTRDMSLVGVPQYCAWDSWAGHVKRKVVRKPRPMSPDAAAQKIREGIVNRNPGQGEKLVHVRRGDLPRPPEDPEKFKGVLRTQPMGKPTPLSPDDPRNQQPEPPADGTLKPNGPIYTI
jgi:hypothetical protein